MKQWVKNTLKREKKELSQGFAIATQFLCMHLLLKLERKKFLQKLPTNFSLDLIRQSWRAGWCRSSKGSWESNSWIYSQQRWKSRGLATGRQPMECSRLKSLSGLTKGLCYLRTMCLKSMLLLHLVVLFLFS